MIQEFKIVIKSKFVFILYIKNPEQVGVNTMLSA